MFRRLYGEFFIEADGILTQRSLARPGAALSRCPNGGICSQMSRADWTRPAIPARRLVERLEDYSAVDHRASSTASGSPRSLSR